MTMDPPTASAPAPLRCLGGQPAPPAISADLAILKGLPPAARRQLYRVLGPCLAEPVPSSSDAQINDFCHELSVDVEALARAIKASRYLLRKAAMQDLGEAEFAEDLERLGDTGEIRAVLLPGYEMVKQVVRSEVIRGAVADHGKVVERVAWRVDHVTASSQADALDVPVAVLTLWYREGDKQDRLTLQLLPEALEELRGLCDRFR